MNNEAIQADSGRFTSISNKVTLSSLTDAVGHLTAVLEDVKGVCCGQVHI
jgi:hypothetical protein